MKINSLKISLLAFGVLMTLGSAWSLPVLQVDLEAGDYNGSDPNEVLNESTIVMSDNFTVDAIFTPGGNTQIPADVYYLAIGVSDAEGNAVSDLGGGTILVDGVALTGFTVGIPSGLPSYGPYPTLYALVDFNFENAISIETINVEDDPGDPVPDANGNSLMVQFEIDRSGLSSDYLLTIDLFGGGKFAPPSHNGASSIPVPEPATFGLLALGGGCLLARRRRKIVS